MEKGIRSVSKADSVGQNVDAYHTLPGSCGERQIGYLNCLFTACVFTIPARQIDHFIIAIIINTLLLIDQAYIKLDLI